MKIILTLIGIVILAFVAIAFGIAFLAGLLETALEIKEEDLDL